MIGGATVRQPPSNLRLGQDDENLKGIEFGSPQRDGVPEDVDQLQEDGGILGAQEVATGHDPEVGQNPAERHSEQCVLECGHETVICVHT